VTPGVCREKVLATRLLLFGDMIACQRGVFKKYRSRGLISASVEGEEVVIEVEKRGQKGGCQRLSMANEEQLVDLISKVES
jgi:fructose-specific phosphotransferase system component IIB